MSQSESKEKLTVISRIEKALLCFTTFVIALISCLIIIEGIANFMRKNYYSLGDPYYSKNIPAFERLPFVAKTTAGTLALIIVIESGLLIHKKIQDVKKK